MNTLIILCTGNSCRSQMAEAYAKQFLPNNWEVSSAGIEKHGLNPYMLRVMQEDGIDMSQHRSKTIGELPEKKWGTLVTVCSHAETHCPYLPTEKHIHKAFPDPPALAKNLEEEDALQIYRGVRDKIKRYFQSFAQEQA